MTAAAPPAVSTRGVGGWLPGILLWLVLPAVCLVTIWVGAGQLASHVNHVPSGVRGTFVVTTHNCQQELCITGGTFTSDDKAVVAHDLLGIYRWTLGTSHRVVYNLDAADVIPLPAHWDPSGAVLGIAGALVLLGIWAWFVRGAVRRARTQPVQASAGEPVDLNR